MKRFLVPALLGLTALAVVPLGSLRADDPPGEQALPEGEPVSFFTMRNFRVKNATAETLTVFVQFRTVEDKAWKWLPGEPDSGVALSFELPAGKEVVLEHDGARLAASRVRLWAMSDKLAFTKHRDQDLWLVPEIDGDQHRYKAASIETFAFEFTAPMGGEPATELPPPPPMPVPEPPIPEGTPTPLPEPLPPLPPPVGPPPPLDPGFPVPPVPKIADLAVENLSVNATGAFAGTVRNFGPGTFIFGRQWFLLKFNKVSGNFQIVKQGLVPPLLPLGGKTFTGNVGPINEKSKFVFAVTKGDNNPFNDKTAPVFVTGLKSDLAVTGLKVMGDVLEGTITNLGPADYAGNRTFHLGDNPNLVPNKTGKVPPLAKGAKATVTLNVKAALDSKVTFFLKLSGGPGDNDDVPANDVKELTHLPKADLAVTDLKVVGKILVGKITNLGPNGYKGPRTYTLGSNLKKVTKEVNDLAKGQSQIVTLNIDSVDHLAQTFTLTISGIDANPANESKSLAFVPKKADLAVINVSKAGNMAKAVVKNVGDAKSAGMRSLTVSYRLLGTWHTAKVVMVSPLDPNASQMVAVNIPPLASNVRAQLNHVAGDNPGNDSMIK